MRITVFGATGGTGVEVVRQALAAGHEVTAVVRDPARLPAELRERAEVVQADVMDPEAIRPAVAGRDAVISALGPRGRGPTTICTDGIRSIAAACEAAGVRRVLMVSASGLAADAGDGAVTRYVVKPMILQRLLRHAFADMSEAESVLGGTKLDWTVVRPPRLLDKPGKGTYRRALDLNVRRGFQIPRADVATALLDHVQDQGSVRHIVTIAT
ncbi:SDR family oxidoreductase [Spirillospora sp. NPDC029432]|uniref:NAD(P)-dependent oxidoreductase n=1 Tax=Spirillospora sp. NPDC029432 TaxID=3154599 RepID=UPI0034549C97